MQLMDHEFQFLPSPRRKIKISKLRSRSFSFAPFADLKACTAQKIFSHSWMAEKIPPENIEVIKASKASKESKSICPTHNSGNSFHQEDRKNSEHGNPSARGGDPKLKP